MPRACEGWTYHDISGGDTIYADTNMSDFEDHLHIYAHHNPS